jgi:benzodiazapine receptor
VARRVRRGAARSPGSASSSRSTPPGPPTFFGLRSLGGGLIVIVALLVTIAVTIARFAPRSRLAAGLLTPYLAWVAFATALNAALWSMN